MDDAPSESIQRCVWGLQQISIELHLVESISEDNVG
jgi:hypothetical protein